MSENKKGCVPHVFTKTQCKGENRIESDEVAVKRLSKEKEVLEKAFIQIEKDQERFKQGLLNTCLTIASDEMLVEIKGAIERRIKEVDFNLIYLEGSEALKEREKKEMSVAQIIAWVLFVIACVLSMCYLFSHRTNFQEVSPPYTDKGGSTLSIERP